MPPMQRRTLYAFITIVVVPAVLVPIVLLVIKPTLDSLIPLLLLTLAASTVVAFVPRYLTRPRPDQPVSMDERDKAIVSSVPRYQSVGILLTIGVWIIVLLGIYDVRGQVPIKSLWLMWCSILAAIALSATAGVMIGYWRAESPSQTTVDPDYLLGAVVTGKWRVTILMFLIVVIVIVLVFAPRSQSGPQADFAIDTAVVQVGEPVRFTDTTEHKDSSFMGEAAAQRWEFSDCTFSDEPNPLHAYSSPDGLHSGAHHLLSGRSRGSGRGLLTVLPPESQ